MNWGVRILLCIGYSIPYGFFAMHGDVVSGTMLFYGVMIVCFAVLCYFSTKTANIKSLVVGNILSYFSSYGFMLGYQTEEWSWYFKPFTAHSLLVVLSVAALFLQLAFVYYDRVSRGKGGS